MTNAHQDTSSGVAWAEHDQGAAVQDGLLVSWLDCGDLKVVRLRSDATGFGMLPALPRNDTYVVAIKLAALERYNLFLAGRHVSQRPIAAGGLCMVEPHSEARLDLQSSFDILQLHFPITLLADHLAVDAERRHYTLRAPPFGTPDQVANQLARVFLPLLEQPKLASRLLLSHIVMALSAHLLHTYGSVQAVDSRRGGLARWQEQCAKELLAAHLDGSLSMSDLAAICQMTPSHFATAFRKTTGMPPTAWLAKLRIAKACELLKHTRLTLAEVALSSGFADQAHFTRCFSRLMGVSPGHWRRLS